MNKLGISLLQPFWNRLRTRFSYVGLAFGTLFFCVSLTPSLLPREFIVQGIESGFALAIGYGVGVSFVWLAQLFEVPQLPPKWERMTKRVTTGCVGVIVVVALYRATVWQNSIRELMEMPPLENVYAPYVVLLAVLCALLLVMAARLFWMGHGVVDRRLKQYLPPRVSNLLSILIVIVILFTVTNRLVIRQLLNAANQAFLEIDQRVDDGMDPPEDALASGSAASLIDWNTIGRQGKNFILSGPNTEEIEGFLERPAKQPIRVYVGLAAFDTPEERAQLALDELIRAGGFDRSTLVVANPTGTGWLQPEAVDTLEYLHAGDTAIVSMQYSYLPSWMTILVDTEGSRISARALFAKVYQYWRGLPEENRPDLYLQGLSLGAFGSEVCADLFTLFEDPIQGGVWSGPPFPSSHWLQITRARNPGSPAWLPTFRDGRMVRFTARENALPREGDSWGAMRYVYIQHASDPMTFFSPELLYEKPAWLQGERGPDVSPYLTWYPVITCLQIAFDLPLATSVPPGYGHNIAAPSYIDAWYDVTQPPDWNSADLKRLKEHFAD